MKRKLSCRESNDRWKNLHQVPLVANKNESHPLSAGEEDPFDCKSLAVPPTRTLVESVLEEHVQRWKELDFRKIQRQRGNKNNDAMEGGPRQLILPPNFDYRTNLNVSLIHFRVEVYFRFYSETISFSISPNTYPQLMHRWW